MGYPGRPFNAGEQKIFQGGLSSPDSFNPAVAQWPRATGQSLGQALPGGCKVVSTPRGLATSGRPVTNILAGLAGPTIGPRIGPIFSLCGTVRRNPCPRAQTQPQGPRVVAHFVMLAQCRNRSAHRGAYLVSITGANLALFSFASVIYG